MSSVSNGDRLFSHLRFHNNQLRHHPGSVLGNSALVAGTTIGAGILALPSVTVSSGILPSTLLLIAVWLYAVISGLLIAEVNLNLLKRSGKTNAGILAMVEATLGKKGGKIAGLAYLFLHYALLVAYISQGGEILSRPLSSLFRISLPSWVGATVFIFIFGSILYFGRQKLVERLNSLLVVIVIVAFIGLMTFGMSQVNSVSFSLQHWRSLPRAVPVMLVALFFHNVIPVVTSQLEGDVVKIRQSIVVGSFIPLLMFLAWNVIVLSGIDWEFIQALESSGSSIDVLEILSFSGTGQTIEILIVLFSIFAISTSFIGFVYGLLDFFRDFFPFSRQQPKRRLGAYSLVLFPSFCLSILNPYIFLTALDYAGTFSISLLGGIIPSLMAWKLRYTNSSNLISTAVISLVRGGKITLVGIVAIAVIVIAEHLVKLVIA